MSETRSYIEKLLAAQGILIPEGQQALLDTFAGEEQYIIAIQQIKDIQQRLMANWKLTARINDIMDKQLIIPNAMVGKAYKAVLDWKQLGMEDIRIERWEGLAETGLAYNEAQQCIEGKPVQNGDMRILFFFSIEGEEESAELHEKAIHFFINADPKSLWKNIPSDANAPYAKPDEVLYSAPLGDKHIVAVSKRGRSHQNNGSFREDDIAFKHISATGWSVVAVSDGAGSYPLSRIGSAVASKAVVDFFDHPEQAIQDEAFEAQLLGYQETHDEQLLDTIKLSAKQRLYKASLFAHEEIKLAASEIQAEHPELFNNPKIKNPLDYFHSTLIYVLFKKYEFGYVVLSFGVGDCPIAVMNSDHTATTLMNRLDVGDFGGGTRFITQNEIFHATEIPMESRFSMEIFPDFAYLFLMTDGIYDPKFVVEAQLEQHSKWLEFLEDLKGNNESDTAVLLTRDNPDIAVQLSEWMDFWSVGNHDDRTLAIIF